MFETSDYLIGKMARERQKDLLEEARIERLVKKIRVEKPGTLERLLSASGELLVRFGRKLIMYSENGKRKTENVMA